jgi:hypothetical protein
MVSKAMKGDVSALPILGYFKNVAIALIAQRLGDRCGDGIVKI